MFLNDFLLLPQIFLVKHKFKEGKIVAVNGQFNCAVFTDLNKTERALIFNARIDQQLITLNVGERK